MRWTLLALVGGMGFVGLGCRNTTVCATGYHKDADGNCYPDEEGDADTDTDPVPPVDSPTDTNDTDSGWINVPDPSGDSWDSWSWGWTGDSWGWGGSGDSWTWSWPSGDSWSSWDTGLDTATLTKVLLGWQGDVTVDTQNATWSGTETLYLREGGAGLPSTGALLCEYTYDASGTGPSTVTTPCQDPTGNACVWTFDVDLSNSRPTGGDCASYFMFSPADTSRSYGYVTDFQANAMSYGPMMLYFDGSGWTRGPLDVNFPSVTTTTVQYDWPIAYYWIQ